MVRNLVDIEFYFKTYFIKNVSFHRRKALYLCESLVDAYCVCHVLESYGYHLVIRSYNNPAKYLTCRYSVLAYYPKPKI